MKCDGLVLELTDIGDRARQRLEGKYTCTCKQGIYAMKILPTERIIVKIVLFKDRQRFIRFKRG
jgi:hypothetical protein